MLGRLDHRVPRCCPLRAEMLYLHDKDDRVADENADQGQHTQGGHETQGGPTRQQCRDNAYEAEGRHRHDQK